MKTKSSTGGGFEEGYCVNCDKSLCYGDFGEVEDNTLIKMRGKLMDYLEKNQTQLFIRKLYELMEVERELTLRENN